MSAFGPKRTWPSALHMSAFGGKADVALGYPATWLLTQVDVETNHSWNFFPWAD